MTNTLRVPGRWVRAIAVAGVVVMAATGCSNTSARNTAAGSAVNASGPASGTLRLGYFANVTHAPAIIGEEKGLFAKALGSGVKIEYFYFNSGTEATEALFSGAIDATFTGPNPAINAFAKSKGAALRIVAGTTSGGASLVVRSGISSAADLKGAKLATPSLGNTQDVALRAWLAAQGYQTDSTGGGDVSIAPQANADTLTAFQSKTIDGAWAPEPWATRLVEEGGGHVLVDERDLWPNRDFVTTQLVVATDYLAKNPAIVRGLIAGLLDAIDQANADPTAAQATVNAGIKRITTKGLATATISGAWAKMRFTPDPIASSLEKSKNDAVAAGLLKPVDLKGIYDLTILNQVLAERHQSAVAAP